MGARGLLAGFATTLLGSLVAQSATATTPARDVIVHLHATPDVTLEREDGDEWVEVCFAPCDMPFSARKNYRVGGGIRDSDPFRLRETSPGLAVVVVEPRSRGMHALGDVLIGVGSAATFFGLFFAGLSATVAESCSGGMTRDSCGGRELIAPSLTVAAVGVGVIILGVDLVVVNSASRVHPESSAEESRDDVSRMRTMFLDLSRIREDAWKAPPASGAVPIFSYRF